MRKEKKKIHRVQSHQEETSHAQIFLVSCVRPQRNDDRNGGNTTVPCAKEARGLRGMEGRDWPTGTGIEESYGVPWPFW